jgi:hypothetical protein
MKAAIIIDLLNAELPTIMGVALPNEPEDPFTSG